MKKLPEPVPVLRELRRTLLLEMSGGKKRVPTDGEIRAWMLEQYRLNPVTADVYRSTLLAKEDLVLREDELPRTGEALDLMSSLEDRPLPKNCFASITTTDGAVHGILMQQEQLQVGGLVYAVTIFSPTDQFSTVSRVEVRACSHEPEPFVSLMTQSGWHRYSKTDAAQNEFVVLIVRCLAAYHQYKYRKIPIGQISSDENILTPPSDGTLDRLIRDAYLGIIPCTKVSLKLDRIEPEDMDFALQISSDIIKNAMTYVVDAGIPSVELLLYERHGKLVMGDDYPIYLAYRALLYKDVPAVIIGSFNREGINIIREGHGELIPPIVVASAAPVKVKKIVSDQQKQLKQKLSLLAPVGPTSTGHFENLYVSFARLLADHKTAERDLHRFIATHPVIVDSHLASMYSEVCIGSYRADLILRYEQLDKRILLIELERHDDLIFKRSNRLRDKVNHAVQQVEDWISSIREDATPMPEWLDKSYVPEGVVVIGRNKDMTRVQRDTLFNINSNRVVKVITYDDLLERLKRLIDMLARRNL
ncbi:MAG: hypothetical protein A3F78_04055 [Burkholderiales bacterium RIFCSPLOWO2_12_FULL_61_40]|nr:MAG: hypothetical protein A3F78_04055 [Burkholderiales bacterium RIFCSPLOWO2_12_FULL_61_40]